MLAHQPRLGAPRADVLDRERLPRARTATAPCAGSGRRLRRASRRSSIMSASHRDLIPSRTRPGAARGRSRRGRPAPPSPSSIGLYAIGVSSITSSSLRHSMPAVAATWSSTVNRRFASPRDIARPAPWLHEQNALGVALAAHDVAARAHRARDDAELAERARAPRPCA